MGQFLGSLHQVQINNYDAVRFSFDGVDRSSEFNLEYHLENLCFFIANHERFHSALVLLEDQTSRDLFVELILWRLAGHLHVKLSTNTAEHWRFRREGMAIPSLPSHFTFGSIFGPIEHFEDLRFRDQIFMLDCWQVSLAWTLLIKQYFFKRGDVDISPGPRDHVIDAGSFVGDTTLAFAAAVGAEGRVYAFDPLESHGDVVRHNIAQNRLEERIRFFPVGLGAFSNDVMGPVKEEELLNPGFNLRGAGGDDLLPIRTIDGLVAAGDIQRVDFLKMDIEGYELAALQGAEKSIRKFKPKLAISVYHNFSDFLEIPSFIRSLDLGYRMHLDHYTIHAEETILYAETA